MHYSVATNDVQQHIEVAASAAAAAAKGQFHASVRLPENHAEWEDFKQHRRTNWQMFLFACHGQRGERERAIIERQLKCDVHRVEKDLLAHQLNVHLLVVEMASHLRIVKH